MHPIRRCFVWMTQIQELAFREFHSKPLTELNPNANISYHKNTPNYIQVVRAWFSYFWNTLKFQCDHKVISMGHFTDGPR